MTAAAWPMLAERGVPSGPECTVAQGDLGGSPSVPSWRIEQLADAMDERPRGALHAQGVLASLAGGLRPPAATLTPSRASPVTPASLRDVDVARLLARPASPLSVERLRDFGSLGIVDRARVTGSVPRAVAEQLAAGGDSLPVGDPVMMTMTLVARRDGVSIESPMFVYGSDADAPRESVYAYADGRALQQALAALIVQATPETLQASPALARADVALRAIANFENGPLPAKPCRSAGLPCRGIQPSRCPGCGALARTYLRLPYRSAIAAAHRRAARASGGRGVTQCGGPVRKIPTRHCCTLSRSPTASVTRSTAGIAASTAWTSRVGSMVAALWLARHRGRGAGAHEGWVSAGVVRWGVQ